MAGSYTVTITDSKGCSATTEIALSQPTAVVASLVVLPATCGSTDGSARASATGGTGAYVYSWSGGVSGSSFQVSGLAKGSYTVTVTDGNSCPATAAANISSTGSAVLNVSGSQTICGGQSATLSATVSSGTPPFTYSWSSGGFTGPGPYSVSPTSTVSYTVSVADSAGCSSKAEIIIVTVNPALTTKVSAAGGNSVCAGGVKALNAEATGGNGGPYNYTWLPDGGNSASALVSPVSNSTFTVIVSDNCSRPDTALISVAVNPLPTLSMSSTVNSGCGEPLCVQFTGTATGVISSTTWTFGDNESSSLLSPAHCYTAAGSYSVTFSCTDTNGCSFSDTTSNMIRVFAKPKASFTYNPNPATESNLISFDNLSSGAQTYIWKFNDRGTDTDSLSDLINPTHQFKDSGKYCVLLIAFSANCSDSSIQCLDVNQACSISDSIPNVFTPNADGVNDLFVFKNSGLSQLNCTIFNRWGMEIFSYDAIHSGWDGRTFGENPAPAGTYYYILDASCLDGKQKKGQGFLQLLR